MPDPRERHWTLVLRLDPSQAPRPATVEVRGRRLLCLPDTDGGWRVCLARCAECVAGPAQGGGAAPDLPVMMVDDELYVLLDSVANST